MFPMPRAEYLRYAMQTAAILSPQTRRVVIESCTHHASSIAGDVTAPKPNQIVCAKFAKELRDHMRVSWPDYTFDLVCYPEAESIRRMLGSRVLIMAVPSSFAFVTGVQKAKNFVTPKSLGVEPSWDTDTLHQHVPWSMYDGTAGTDSLTPVDLVPTTINSISPASYRVAAQSRQEMAVRGSTRVHKEIGHT